MSGRGEPGVPSVTVVGSANVDLVVRCEHLPAPGETVAGAGLERVAGGKGANQAVALARMGADVRFVGRVGFDDHGDLLLDALRVAGVDAERTERVDLPTGLALIAVDEHGENHIIVVAGANGGLGPDDLGDLGTDAVLCQLEIPLDTVVAAAQRTTGMFCLNPSPARALPAALVDRVDLLLVNRHEHAVMPEVPERTLVAVTHGAAGAMLLRDGEIVARASPPPIVAVDGTAAGDAFCAALIFSLLTGCGEGASLERACAAGALTATRVGAQPSLPTLADVMAIQEGLHAR